jgi:hypothetical protein
LNRFAERQDSIRSMCFRLAHIRLRRRAEVALVRPARRAPAHGFAALHGNGHFLPYVPNRYEAFILSNRKILADQMEFLLQGVPKASRMHAA